jgi:hypothetical protein
MVWAMIFFVKIIQQQKRILILILLNLFKKGSLLKAALVLLNIISTNNYRRLTMPHWGRQKLSDNLQSLKFSVGAAFDAKHVIALI